MPVTKHLETLSRGIDRFTEGCGRAVSWLTLLMVIITVTIVVMRYLLEIGSIALQESLTYLHATVFMLAAAFTLKRGGHVRVDIFYRKMSVKQQALVDALGGLLFLLPLCGLIFWLSLGYVSDSWSMKEVSNEPGGLPLLYLLKSLLLAMPCLLALQGVAEILKNSLFFLGLGGAHTDAVSHQQEGQL